MAGVNKAIVVGNLGQPPEAKFLADGKAVTKISIATSDSWKDKATGERKEATEWHSVVMYDKLAEIAAEYLKKGSKVYIEGKLKTSKWVDEKTGQNRTKTDIIASVMQMLDGKNVPHGTSDDEPKWADKETDNINDDIPF